MPASQRSLQVTEQYRSRLFSLRARLEEVARRLWPTIEELDSTDWVDKLAAFLTQSQTTAIRVTSAYLTAFLTTELGERTTGPSIDSATYSGLSRDGRPLAESLRSPLIGTLGRLKQGDTPEDALSYGLNRATRMVGMDFDSAHRSALVQTIDKDERFDGWNRAIRGGCGACAAKARGLSHDLWFPVHPGCQCVAEPNVKGTPETFPRPTGQELFNSRSRSEQDEMLGPEIAELVRLGEIELGDLVEVTPMARGEDFITQTNAQEER